MDFDLNQLEKRESDCGLMEARQPSLLDATTQKLERARMEVKRLEELVTLLQKNPTVNRIMELLGGRF